MMTDPSKPSKPDTTPTVVTAHLDISQVLARLVHNTGLLQDTFGGFRIKVLHTGAFPWAAVFKELLYRNFRVDVTRQKAEIFIEARP